MSLYNESSHSNHPDHLGSTAMVTDVEGRITQNVAYIPFGEVFVEERDGNWNTPYLFNAKEMDSETGLYYYGARYLDPTAAMWMTVDPLFEKYPGISPYNYCEGNPVKLVDPDGEAVKGIENGDAETFVSHIQSILKDDKFEKFRSLFSVTKKQINSISESDKAEALEGVQLSKDESCFIDAIFSAVNSKEVHYVYYVEGRMINSMKKKFLSRFETDFPRLASELYKHPENDRNEASTGYLKRNYGGGLTFKLDDKSTLSLITRLDNDLSDNQFYIRSMHEVLGHGFPLLSKTDFRSATNNCNAVRMENLVLRLLNMPPWDGNGHGGYDKGEITSPTILPQTKIK